MSDAVSRVVIGQAENFPQVEEHNEHIQSAISIISQLGVAYAFAKYTKHPMPLAVVTVSFITEGIVELICTIVSTYISPETASAIRSIACFIPTSKYQRLTKKVMVDPLPFNFLSKLPRISTKEMERAEKALTPQLFTNGIVNFVAVALIQLTTSYALSVITNRHLYHTQIARIMSRLSIDKETVKGLNEDLFFGLTHRHLGINDTISKVAVREDKSWQYVVIDRANGESEILYNCQNGRIDEINPTFAQIVEMRQAKGPLNGEGDDFSSYNSMILAIPYDRSAQVEVKSTIPTTQAIQSPTLERTYQPGALRELPTEGENFLKVGNQWYLINPLFTH